MGIIRTMKKIKIRKPYWILAGVMLCLAVSAVGLLLVFNPLVKGWKTPLGPLLGLDGSDPNNPFGGSAQYDPELGEPLCGGPQIQTILAVGADSDNYLYGLADIIRIVRVDYTQPRVTVLYLPRDLWVDIPDIAQASGVTQGKLNQAYFFGNPGMGFYDGPAEGPGLLARTLDVNYGLRLDNYVAVNMVVFVDIIDTLGGIDVTLTQKTGGVAAGTHHLNGTQALEVARDRKNTSDFARSRNQTLILQAIRAKLLQPAVLLQLPQLVNLFLDSVQTGFTPEEISHLVCLLPELEDEDIVYASLPEELFTPTSIYDSYRQDYTFILEVDNAVVRDYIAQFMAGVWP
jgi:LCP family protein required for cell wall assembly